MPRSPRLEAENCFYHITSRGNNKNPTYTEKKDYKKFLEYLLKTKEKFNFYIYAYVLMTNHFHLLIQTRLANLSKIMHYLNTSYTVYYNRVHNKCGHLFQGRYKSLLVDTDNYFLKLTRYIHLNPVKAKIVEKPEDYKWSSYRDYLNKRDNQIIDKKEINALLNMSSKDYENFVLAGMHEEEKLFEDIYGGCILGGDNFIKNNLKKFKNEIENKNISYQKKMLYGKIEINDIIEKVQRYYKINTVDLTSRKRNFWPRKIAIYLAQRFTQLNNREIGEVFGIRSSSVCKLTHATENFLGENKNLNINAAIQTLISYFSA